MYIETLARPMRRSYEEFFLTSTQRQLHQLLFPIVDEDEAETFLLDRYIQDPYGVSYREWDSQSVIRQYSSGEGTIYKVPHSSEKTPIPESLRGIVAAGLEPTAPITEHTIRIVNAIVSDHVTGHRITKNKQALDVIREGVFYANSVEGKDINVGVDFNRAGTNSITYDFTQVGANMSAALKAMVDVIHITNKGPVSNIVFILGSSWLQKFSTDTNISAYLQANIANTLLMQNLTPTTLENVEGLYLLSTFRAPQMLAPVFICSYDPGILYKAYRGATLAPWIPDNEAIAFPLNAKRYSVYRGMDVIDETGAIKRLTGEVLFDAYTERDPVVQFTRSHTRHIFVPGNINLTVKSTGTFS
jgi:hypothetical protein